MKSEIAFAFEVDDEQTKLLVPRRSPGIWTGFGVVLLYFAMQLVAGLVLGIAAGFWYGATHAHATHTANAGSIGKLTGNSEFTMAATVAGLIFATAVTLWVVRRRWPDLWATREPPGFGMIKPQSMLYFAYAVLAGLILAVLSGPLTNLIAHGREWHQDVAQMALAGSWFLRIPLILSVVCVAPAIEELVFRGVLLSGLMHRLRTGWAVILSALLFGCVHVPDFKSVWYAVPAIVLMGLVLAWLRLKSRSLWPAITAHATNNLVVIVGLVLASHLHG